MVLRNDLSCAPLDDMGSPIVLQTAVMLLIVLFLGWLWSRRRLYVLGCQVPGPAALPIIGNAIQLFNFPSHHSIVDTIVNLSKIYGSFYRIWIGSEINVVITEADDLENILSSKTASKKGKNINIMNSAVIGDVHLELLDDESDQHSIISPAFSTRSIEGYQPILDKLARKLVENMTYLCDDEDVDVVLSTQQFAADTICECLFEWEARFYNGEKNVIIKMIQSAVQTVQERIHKPWLIPDFIFNLSEIGKCFNSQKIMYNYLCADIIRAKSEKNLNERASRKQDNITTPDELPQTVLSLLINSVESGKLTMDELCEEFNTILNSGVNIGYKLLSSFILLMGMNKEHQNKVWKEIKENLGDDLNSKITTDQLCKVPYLDLCLKETMRLFTIGPIQQLQLHSDLYLQSKNVLLPSGVNIIYCPFLLHKNPKYWKQPKVFIPERFLAEESLKRPQFSFIPFTPRYDIGEPLTINAVKTAAVHLIRNFEFKSNQNTEVRGNISSKKTNEGMVKITRRKCNQ